MNDNQRLDEVRTGEPAGLGSGRKLGFFGCGFILLAILIVFLVLALTGAYNPFEGIEGVGP